MNHQNKKPKIVLDKLPTAFSPEKVFSMQDVEAYCSSNKPLSKDNKGNPTTECDRGYRDTPDKQNRDGRKSTPTSAEICAKRVLRRARRTNKQTQLREIFMSPKDQDDFEDVFVKKKRGPGRPSKKQQLSTKTLLKKRSQRRRVPTEEVCDETENDIAQSCRGHTCPTCKDVFSSINEMQAHIKTCLHGNYSLQRKTVTSGSVKRSKVYSPLKGKRTSELNDSELAKHIEEEERLEIEAEKRKDAELAKQIQQSESQESVSSEECVCLICNKDLSYMTTERKSQHVNRCIDLSISGGNGFPTPKGLETVKTSKKESAVLMTSSSEQVTCQICEKDLTHMSEQRRAVHINSCIDGSSSRQTSTTDRPRGKPPGRKSLFEIISERGVESSTGPSDGCPICGKNIHSMKVPQVHIKKCAMKNNVSTIKVMEMIRQQKQAVSSVVPGDTSVSTKPSSETSNPIEQNTKTKKSRKIKPPTSVQDEQMALARAMSLSLSKQEQEYGKRRRGRRGAKNKLTTVPPLLLKSQEEIKRGLAEKVSSILTQSEFENFEAACTPPMKRSRLHRKCRESQDRGQLWKLTGENDPESNAAEGFYVHDLREVISPVKKKRSTRRTPVKRKADTDEDFSTQAFGRTVQMLADLAEEGECITSPSKTQTPIQVADKTSQVYSHYQQQLVNDMSAMVNCKDYSDVVIHVDGAQTIHSHAFMLGSRCQALAQMLTEAKGHHSKGKIHIQWPDVSFDDAMCVLKFIYSAKIDIPVHCLGSILQLAERFEIYDLQKRCHEILDEKSNIHGWGHSNDEVNTTETENEKREDKEFVEKDVDDLLNSLWGGENSSREPSASSSDHDEDSEQFKKELDNVYEYMSTQRAATQRSRSKKSNAKTTKFKGRSPQGHNTEMNSRKKNSSTKRKYNRKRQSARIKSHSSNSMKDADRDRDCDSEGMIRCKRLSKSAHLDHQSVRNTRHNSGLFETPISTRSKSVDTDTIVTPELFGDDDDDDSTPHIKSSTKQDEFSVTPEVLSTRTRIARKRKKGRSPRKVSSPSTKSKSSLSSQQETLPSAALSSKQQVSPKFKRTCKQRLKLHEQDINQAEFSDSSKENMSKFSPSSPDDVEMEDVEKEDKIVISSGSDDEMTESKEAARSGSPIFGASSKTESKEAAGSKSPIFGASLSSQSLSSQRYASKTLTPERKSHSVSLSPSLSPKFGPLQHLLKTPILILEDCFMSSSQKSIQACTTVDVKGHTAKSDVTHSKSYETSHRDDDGDVNGSHGNNSEDGFEKRTDEDSSGSNDGMEKVELNIDGGDDSGKEITKEGNHGNNDYDVREETKRGNGGDGIGKIERGDIDDSIEEIRDDEDMIVEDRGSSQGDIKIKTADVLEENGEDSKTADGLEENDEDSKTADVLEENGEDSITEDVLEENGEDSKTADGLEENDEDSKTEDILVLEDSHENSTSEDILEENDGNSKTEDILEESQEVKKADDILDDSTMDFLDDGGFNVDMCIMNDTLQQDDGPSDDIEEVVAINEANTTGPLVQDECLGGSFITDGLDDSLIWTNPNDILDVERKDDQPLQSQYSTPKAPSFTEPGVVVTPDVSSETPEGPITPMPDYGDMTTPILKGELNKFGVRAMPRKKAVTILKTIYDYTHQGKSKEQTDTAASMSTDREIGASISTTDEANNGKDEPSNQGVTVESDASTERVNTTDDSDSESGDDFGESILMEEGADSDGDDDRDLTASQQAAEEDKATLVKKYIKDNVTWYKKILMYEPFDLTVLSSELKSAGITCSQAKLMDILDEQCITFRIQQGNKGRQKKSKSRKKKRHNIEDEI
ncbi:uncharacterized protein LOC144438810 [Glandiceps talaboti]